MKILKIILLIGVAYGCSSCATIFCGSKKKITFESAAETETPPVTLKIGEEVHPDVNLPYTTKIKRKKLPITVTSSAINYASDSLQLQRKFNPVAILNVLPDPPLAIIGFPVDAITGALRNPAQPDWPLVMKPIGDTTKKEIVINIRVSKRQHQSDYANLLRVGVGLAKWTGIGAPTSRIAFSAGYGRSFNLWKNDVVLEPTLGIALKGMKYKEALGSIGNADLTRKETGTAWYVEAIIPVRYIYGDNKKNWSIGTGPYFGVGIGGQISTTVEGSSSNNPSERDYFGSDGGGIRRFDMGWATDIRYSFSHMAVGLEMLNGTIALSKNDSSVKNFALRLYIGYRF